MSQPRTSCRSGSAQAGQTQFPNPTCLSQQKAGLSQNVWRSSGFVYQGFPSVGSTPKRPSGASSHTRSCTGLPSESTTRPLQPSKQKRCASANAASALSNGPRSGGCLDLKGSTHQYLPLGSMRIPIACPRTSPPQYARMSPYLPLQPVSRRSMKRRTASAKSSQSKSGSADPPLL